MNDSEPRSIAGLSFNGLDLINENFKGVKAGHTRLQKLLLLIYSSLVISFIGILFVFSADILDSIFYYSSKDDYLNLIQLGLFAGIYALTLLRLITHGFEIKIISFIAILISLGAIIAIPFEETPGVGAKILLLGLSMASSSSGMIAAAFVLSFVFICCGFVGEFITLAISGLVILAISQLAIVLEPQLGRSVIMIVLPLMMMLGSEAIARKTIEDTSPFFWMREKIIYVASILGTSFYKANLTNACFEGADLRHTDLRKTNLTRTNFKNVTGLELSRLQGTILEQPSVRKLLTDRDGYGKDFTEADLSNADLKAADLREAILVRAQLLNADLSGACLTDACIQDWNINHNTRFNNVDCKRVYLKRSPSGHFLEPKPDSGEFGPGEFEKWITDVRDTIDLIFQNGLNWRAFAFSLTQTAINNEGIDLSVRSIENKGDGVVVAKVGVSVDTNKTSIHREITEHYDGAVAAIAAKYELVLKAKDDEIDRLVAFHETQQRFIQGLVSGIAEPKEKVLIQGEGNRVYVMNQAGDVMENSNQNINAGGNVDMSTGARVSIGGDVTGSSINLGELSGQVTNTIQQLQDIKTTDGNDLARILTQLQKSINEDQALSDAQKEQALEAVATLAEEGKKPPESRTAKFCSMAINALKGLASSVADVSKLAEMLQTSLPTLTKLLGL